jgi:large subunit ribosomal protein L13e
MALPKRVIVRKKSGEKRKGRGFSREELKKAGISFRQALRFGLPVDVRRRTVHHENVKLIGQQLKKHVSKAKKKTSRK